MKKIAVAAILLLLAGGAALSAWFLLKPTRDPSSPVATLQGDWKTKDKNIQWCFQNNTVRMYNATSDTSTTDPLTIIEEMPQQNAVLFYFPNSKAEALMKFSPDGKTAEFFFGTDKPFIKFEYTGSKCTLTR